MSCEQKKTLPPSVITHYKTLHIFGLRKKEEPNGAQRPDGRNGPLHWAHGPKSVEGESFALGQAFALGHSQSLGATSVPQGQHQSRRHPQSPEGTLRPKDKPEGLGQPQSPLGPARPYGASLSYELRAHVRRPEFQDLAESRPTRFCGGRASPSSWPKPARPRASGLGSTQAATPGSNPRSGAWGRAVFSHGQSMLDPGRNAWVERKSATAKFCSTP